MQSTRWNALLVTMPPFAWITLFLFLPYCLLFCYSFWSLGEFQQIVHHATLANYAHLFTNPLYLTVILRSLRIAFSVVLLSLLIGYPLAYFLVFHSGTLSPFALPGRHHSPLGQLPSARLCMEGHFRQRGRAQHLATLVACGQPPAQL